MNKERILLLAEALKAGDNPPLNGEKLGFNMRNFIAFEDPPPGSRVPSTQDSSTLRDRTGHACGAVGCIAGWAVAMYGTPQQRAKLRSGEIYYQVEIMAAELLGLGTNDAHSLFHPYVDSLYWDAGPDMIAAGLEHFVATGEVVWRET